MPQGKPDCLASIFPARGAACLPVARAYTWDAPEGPAAPSLMSAAFWSLQCTGHSVPVQVWPQGRVHHLHPFCPHPLSCARQPGGCPQLGAAGRCPQSPGPENQVAPAGFPVLHLPLPSTSCPLLLHSLSTPSKGLQLCTCIHRGHSAGCSRTGLGFICLGRFTHKAGTEGTWFRQEWEVWFTMLSPRPGGRQGALLPIGRGVPSSRPTQPWASESGGMSALPRHPWLDSMQSGHAAAVASQPRLAAVFP